MNKFLLIIFLLYFTFSGAQSFIIEYDEIFDDGAKQIVQNSYLTNMENDIYYFNINNSDKNISLEETFKDYKTNKSAIKIKYHVETNTIYDYRFIPQNFYIGEEEIPSQNWTIENETKNILGYTCRRAFTFFRGRKYIAWFTKEIPILYGPWKLNGLPGLILEVNDSDNFFRFLAKNIILNAKWTVPDQLISFFISNPQNVIPYEVLYSKETVFLEELRSKIRANAPVGTKFIDDDIRSFLKEKKLEK